VTWDAAIAIASVEEIKLVIMILSSFAKMDNEIINCCFCKRPLKYSGLESYGDNLMPH
jgi:hypothetical protein